MGGPSTYSEYQALTSSEKLTLAVIEASKRLVGWALHSGSVYKLQDFEHSAIVSIEDSGTAYVAATSVAGVTAGKYYFDRQARVLYLRAIDSSNPNSRFIGLTFRLFFSDGTGVILPNDMASGFEVEWLPILSKTSRFGVELDNQNQIGVAIEGSGTIELYNDAEYWKPRYDRFYFENQKAFIYSWNRELPISEARLIYRGRVEGKSYSEKTVKFTLKDYVAELKNPIPLENLQSIGDARIPDRLKLAKLRKIYGYVFGMVPVNIDQVLDGYPLTGTVSIASGSGTMTGAGTNFLSSLSPDDEILVEGLEDSISVGDITDDVTLTMGDEYTGLVGIVDAQAWVKPKTENRFMNRKFVIAGHALREPATTVTDSITPSIIEVASTEDLNVGDVLVVNGEVTALRRLLPNNRIKLTTALVTPPPNGSDVIRAAVTGVKINTRELQVDRDYTYSANDGTLELDPLAEFNVSPISPLVGSMVFTLGSRVVTGTGTFFKADMRPGDWIRGEGQADWFEILSVDADDSLRIRVACTYSDTGPGEIKRPEVYQEGKSVLTCDALGATDDGTTDGALLKTGPKIVEDILIGIGLGTALDSSSFDDAAAIAQHRLGFVIPKKYSDSNSPTAKSVIDEINQSVFGSLIQNADFQLEYSVLQPSRPSSLLQLKEYDVLKFAIESKSDKIAKTILLEYQPREYDPISKASIVSTATATSPSAQYLAKTSKEQTVKTLLVDQESAEIYARRWAFLQEVATSALKISTKLQGSRLSVGDKVDVSHSRMYERIGGSGARKIAAVQSMKKDGSGVDMELEDLGNAFSRCGSITADDALPYEQATESERVRNGFITDSYGMQDNDPETFGSNLIW